MSQLTTLTCDRCEAIVAMHLAERWMQIEVNGAGSCDRDIHICPACVPAIAAILPRVDRSRFARFLVYDQTITMTSTERVTAAVQLTEVAKIAWQPQRIVIEGRPADWGITDILVGNRSQLATRGEIPGDCFSEIDNLLVFDTVHAQMDFLIRAVYRGANPEGAIFTCKVQGQAIGWPPAQDGAK